MLIVLCRSGTRSARATEGLAQSGFINVYTVADGFEGDPAKRGPREGHRVMKGWKNLNLSWTDPPLKTTLSTAAL